MKKRNLILALTFAVIFAPLLRSQQQPPRKDQQPVIRARVDVVNVLCTVREDGGKGKYVEDLKKDDFEVYEDGIRENIEYFNHGMGEDADPLSIALLIDTSGSVKSKLAFEQKAAVEFLKSTLRKNKDLAAVLQFHEEVELVQDFTYDPELLRNAILETRAGGGTKLYDAVYVASNDLLKNEIGRRVMVVLSDGDDTLSELPKKDAIKGCPGTGHRDFRVRHQEPGYEFRGPEGLRPGHRRPFRRL